MFGLEGSGFTISIGVTLLLVGLVVFYFKQRMDEWDNKLQGMLNLNKALAASHAALEQRVMAGTYSTNNDVPVTDNIATSSSPFDGSDVNNVLADDRQVVSDDSSSDDSESDSDESESEGDENVTQMVIGSELNNVNDNSDGIKVVELASGANNDNQINLNGSEEGDSLEEISLNTSNNNDDEEDDEEDDDDDDDEDDEDDEDDDEDDEDDDSDDDTEATELTTEDISNNVAEMLNVKKVATEVTAELDFKKLNVGKLRELVVTRSLADKAGAKKMKKKQLVELLS